jgi:hypothetical protein
MLDVAVGQRPDQVRERTRLSELGYQDGYSHKTAAIHLGGHSEADLPQTDARCRKALDVGLEPVAVT